MAVTEDFRIQRHIRRHDDLSKLLGRILLVSVLVGVVLPWKFLDPFSVISIRIEETKRSIPVLERERRAALEQKDALEAIMSALHKIQNTVREEPWMNEAEKLRSTFVTLSRGGARWSADQAKYQQAADETVTRVSGNVKELVIRPLRSALESNPGSREALKAISEKVDELERSIDAWQQRFLGRKWYQTVEAKGTTIASLSNNSLKQELGPLSQSITRARQEMDTRAKSLSDKAVSLNEKVTAAEAEFGKLDSEMQKLFPSWLKGVVSIEQMIQVYPLLVLALIAFVIVVGMSISRHHEFVVRSMDLSEAERDDPAISSIWTLASRGRVGTATTLAAYMIFLLVAWALFEWSSESLTIWLNVSPKEAWVPDGDWVITLRWLGRLGFLAIAFLVIYRAVYHARSRLSAGASKDRRAA